MLDGKETAPNSAIALVGLMYMTKNGETIRPNQRTSSQVTKNRTA